jgi:hypothetical protein
MGDEILECAGRKEASIALTGQRVIELALSDMIH